MLSGACALVRTSASQFLVLEDLEGNLLCFWGLAVVFGLFVVFFIFAVLCLLVMFLQLLFALPIPVLSLALSDFS